MIQTIITIIVVIAAVVYFIWKMIKRAKGGCGCGCENCKEYSNRKMCDGRCPGRDSFQKKDIEKIE
ncbi:MAG: FeoB-associated Cys-rich membrane protein [Bacteroidales bacterium]|nr:FeoB-associated Cys-rich membrane protein [Bacteroidales bacterium]